MPENRGRSALGGRTPARAVQPGEGSRPGPVPLVVPEVRCHRQPYGVVADGGPAGAQRDPHARFRAGAALRRQRPRSCSLRGAGDALQPQDGAVARPDSWVATCLNEHLAVLMIGFLRPPDRGRGRGDPLRGPGSPGHSPGAWSGMQRVESRLADIRRQGPPRRAVPARGAPGLRPFPGGDGPTVTLGRITHSARNDVSRSVGRGCRRRGPNVDAQLPL